MAGPWREPDNRWWWCRDHYQAAWAKVRTSSIHTVALISSGRRRPQTGPDLIDYLIIQEGTEQ